MTYGYGNVNLEFDLSKKDGLKKRIMSLEKSNYKSDNVMVSALKSLSDGVKNCNKYVIENWFNIDNVKNELNDNDGYKLDYNDVLETFVYILNLYKVKYYNENSVYDEVEKNIKNTFINIFENKLDDVNYEYDEDFENDLQLLNININKNLKIVNISYKKDETINDALILEILNDYIKTLNIIGVDVYHFITSKKINKEMLNNKTDEMKEIYINELNNFYNKITYINYI